MIIRRNIWQYESLTDAQQDCVRNCTQVMVAEKNWEGVNGFEINDEAKVTISAGASLLVLGLPEPFYFDRVESIIVYPGVIKNRQMHRGMVVDESESYFSGQAWQNGPLLFSWPSVVDGTSRSGDGANVVIHEFAHHIDGLDGEMGGSPIIESEEMTQRWKTVFSAEYERLCDSLESGCQPYIDRYAATNPAEFFAVTTEIFFDSPRRLKRAIPAVFDLLKAYFAVDPEAFKA